LRQRHSAQRRCYERRSFHYPHTRQNACQN
jgi:hypothetical protein